MEYATQENNKKEYTPAGSEYKDIYAHQINEKTGKEFLKKIGKTNVYEMIQADADNAILYNMIEKYQKTGDASVFNTREMFYDNFLNVASSPAEQQNQLMMAEYAFNQLDKEVRAEFENDINVFKHALLNGTFEQKMSKFIKPKQIEIKEENTPKNNETTTQGVTL